jgi:hypothetical protein
MLRFYYGKHSLQWHHLFIIQRWLLALDEARFAAYTGQQSQATNYTYVKFVKSTVIFSQALRISEKKVTQLTN